MPGLRGPTTLFVALTLLPAAILAWLGWNSSAHWVAELRRAARDQTERAGQAAAERLPVRTRTLDEALRVRMAELAERAQRCLPQAAPGAWLCAEERDLGGAALELRRVDGQLLVPCGPVPLAGPGLPEWPRFLALRDARSERPQPERVAAARAFDAPALRLRALATVLRDDAAALARELTPVDARALVAAGPLPCEILRGAESGRALLLEGARAGWLYEVPATEAARLTWLAAAGADHAAMARQALRAAAESGRRVLCSSAPLARCGTLAILRDLGAALAALDLGTADCAVTLSPAGASAPSAWDGPASLRLASITSWGPVAIQVDHRNLPAIERQAERQRLWTGGGIALLVGSSLAGVLLARRALAHERAARALRDDFIANVSHELKTPLTSLRMYADMLAADALAPADRARYGAVAQAEGARLSSLVDDLLDFAALERGRRRIEPEPVDLAAAAQAVSDAWQPRATQLGVVLRRPATDGEVLALADPTALLRILTNLLQNALRHGRPARDGGQSLVTLAVGPGPALEVRDNGPGVPAADRERIFGRFERARRGGEGAGIGLALSRELARACGGRLWCDDDGVCTVFHLELPPVPAGATP